MPQPAVQSIPGPQSNAGIWIDFAGARWYAAGPAVAFSPDRFTRIGERAGFPVYRDRTSTNGNEIYVPAVQDGPVAPFVQR